MSALLYCSLFVKIIFYYSFFLQFYILILSFVSHWWQIKINVTTPKILILYRLNFESRKLNCNEWPSLCCQHMDDGGSAPVGNWRCLKCLSRGKLSIHALSATLHFYCRLCGDQAAQRSCGKIHRTAQFIFRLSVLFILSVSARHMTHDVIAARTCPMQRRPRCFSSVGCQRSCSWTV